MIDDWLLPRAGLLVCLGLASAAGYAQGVQSKPVTMQDLTAPADRLPEGCGLKTIDPGRQEIVSTSPSGGRTVRFVGGTPSLQPYGTTANPWIGTDRPTLGWLRQRVEGERRPPLPDAPLSRGEASALLLRLADGVEEGYSATYRQLYAKDLAVYAVKFVPDHQPRVVLSRLPTVLEIEIGSIQAVLNSDGLACSKAIEAHLRSLGR